MPTDPLQRAIEESEPATSPVTSRQPAIDVYSQIVDSMDEAANVRLRRALGTPGAQQPNPDAAAEARRLSLRFGDPVDLVSRKLDDYRKRARLDVPVEQMVRESPATTAWLGEDDTNTAVAIDDLESLGAIEWLVTAPQRAWSRGQAQVEFGRLNAQSLFRTLSQAERRQLDELRLQMNEGGELGAAQSWFRRAVRGTMQQLPVTFGATLAGLSYGLPAATAAAGGVALAGQAGPQVAVPEEVLTVPLTFAGMMTAGTVVGGAEFGFYMEAGLALDEYQGFRDELGQPLAPEVARMAALATGALNGGLEAAGLAVLAKSIPGVNKLTGAVSRGAVKQALRSPTVRQALFDAAKAYGSTLAAETATEVAQRAVTILSGELGKVASGQSIPIASPSDVASDLGREAVGAMESFLLLSAPGPSMQLGIDTHKARRAQQNVTFFQALGEGVTNSPAMQRAPEAVEKLLQRATTGGPIEHVYAPADTWQTYWQSQGVDPRAVAGELTGDPSSFDRALETGTDLKIPTSRYATRLAGTSHNQFFAGELRLAPGEMNTREAQAWQEEQAAITADQAAAERELTPRERIRETMTARLEGAAVPRSTAEAYASLVEAGVGTLAESAGLDPYQVFQRYGLEVERTTQAEAGKGKATGAPGVAGDQAEGGEAAGAAPATEGVTGPQESDIPAGAPESAPEATGVEALEEEVPGLAELEASLGGATLEERGDEATAANASGDSAASLEATSRGAGMQARGERFVVYDRAGNRRALIGPEAVDYTARRGETYGIEGPNGFQVLDDKGGRHDRAKTEDGPRGGEEPGGSGAERAPADEGGEAADRGSVQSSNVGRRLPSPLDYPLEAFQRATPETDTARLTPAVRSELARIAEELNQFPFVGRTWTWRDDKDGNAAGGNAEIVAGAAGAPVYDDVLDFAPLNKGTKGKALAKTVRGSRREVEGAIRKALETGTIHNNLAEGAVRVAERREAGDYRHISRPALPADWGEPASREFVDGVLEDVQAAIDAGALEQPDAVEDGDGDTSFDVTTFGQSLFDLFDQAERGEVTPDDLTAAAEQDATESAIDILETGEAQPRLPGAGDVREQEIATPEFEAPFSLTSPVDKGRKGKQTTLFQSAPTSPAFVAWFGESKVVDADGKPLRVYHGTFTPEGFEGGEVKAPAYFTPDPAYASMFAATDQGGEEGVRSTTIPVYLKIEQPLDLRDMGTEKLSAAAFVAALESRGFSLSPELQEAVRGFGPARTWEYVRRLSELGLRSQLTDQGFDGIFQIEEATFPREETEIEQPDPELRGTVDETRSAEAYLILAPAQAKSAIGNRGTFDPNDPRMFRQDRRGAITFGADRRFRIQLFEKADLSTFLHETGHFFLEVYSDLADQVAALDPATLTDQQRRMLADYGAVLQALGIENRKQLTTEQHEQFARMFETYLFEGKAPSLELRNVFAKFRAWLLGIYRYVKALDAPLTPEVRAVFDRMLAGERALQAAEAAGSAVPMFLTAEQAGMSPEQFQLYRVQVEDASRAAREELDRKMAAEVERERRREWKAQRAEVLEEVQRDVYAMPVYQALAAIRGGTNPDGSPLIEGETLAPMRLSRAIIADRFGADRLKGLPPLTYSREGGLDPDAVATQFGFGSGDELLTALAGAPPMRQAIAQETDRRMLDRHGSMLIDGTLPAVSTAAVAATDVREGVVRAELRALWDLQATVQPHVDLAERQAAAAAREARRERDYERRWLEAETKLRIAIAEGRKQVEIDKLEAEVQALKARARGGAVELRTGLRGIPPQSAIRDVARTRIAATRIIDLEPGQFFAAARRAAKQALERAARQDFAGAVQAKTQELIALAMYREAEAARADVNRRVRRARDLSKPSTRARLGLAGDTYTDQIDGILDRYEFAQVSRKVLERRVSVLKFVAGLEGEGLPVDLPPEVLEDARRINYQMVTVDELVGVTDGLDQIVHLATLKNRLLAAAAKRDLDKAAADLAGSIRSNARGPARSGSRDRRPSEERRRVVADWFAGHRKLSSFLREMDGFEDGGEAWASIMKPLNEAGAAEAEMTADATRRFAEVIERAFPGREKRTLYTRVHVPAVGRAMSRMERIAVALNWGNEGNRERIRLAEGWNDHQVQGVLDTLSASDLRFVQDVFDLIDSFWPQIEAKQKRVYGIAPAKVEAVAIRTAAGEIAGGYYPLKYDDRLSASAIAKLDLEAANLARNAAYSQATTKRGHTKERAQRVKIPVRLDFGVMFEHVGQVVHDLTHHETLIDVGRLLGHRDVQTAILETQGDLVYKQVRGSIRDVAFGDIPATNGFERAVNHVRTGATIAGLGWNVTTAALQPLGLANSIVRIGPKWVALGIGRWLRGPRAFVDTPQWIEEVSPFMRARARTMQREINEVRNQVGVETGSFSGWIDEAVSTATFDHVSRQGIVDSYFWMIQQMQRIVDVPTWLGAYEKAMAGGETEQRAIGLADQAVLDSQGGGQIKDLAQVQRGGPMMRLWTNFYSFFNVVYNQAVESSRRTNYRHPAEVGRLASDYMMLFIVPATLGFLLRQALRPGDDEDEDLAAALAFENASYIAGTMLGLREVSGALAGSFGYEGPAGARAFASLARLGQQTRQGEADAAFWRSLNDVAGVILHYPAGQAKRTIEGVAAWAEGRTSNPAAVLTGPPRDGR